MTMFLCKVLTANTLCVRFVVVTKIDHSSGSLNALLGAGGVAMIFQILRRPWRATVLALAAQIGEEGIHGPLSLLAFWHSLAHSTAL